MKLLIVNGSPRAPRSNSRRYAELFQARWKGEARYAALTAKNHAELAAAAADCTDLLLVFPLYADGLPAPLLRFLEFLEGAGPEHRPRISVLINCGFLEPHQNDVAVDMVRRRAGGHHAPVPPLLCAGLHTLLDADGRRQRLYAGTDGVHGH